MTNARRHAPVGRYRAPRLRTRRPDGLAHVRAGRARHFSGDVYERDRSRHQSRHPFRWLLSTVLTAGVSLVVTGVVVYGSLDDKPAGPIDILAELETVQANLGPAEPRRQRDGPDWLMLPQDRLQLSYGALTTRHVVHEQVQVRRNNRRFLQIKPYLRIKARLAPADRSVADLIPPFKPTRIYAPGTEQARANDRWANTGHGKITHEIIEMTRAVLPVEDRQRLAPFEVSALVREAIAQAPSAPAVRLGLEQQLIEGLTPGYLTGLDDPTQDAAALVNTTVLVRRTNPADQPVDLAEREVRVVGAMDGETLGTLLKRTNIEATLAMSIERAARTILPDGRLRAGQQIHIIETPASDGHVVTDVSKVTVFDGGHVHRLTVKSDGRGSFKAQANPDQGALIMALREADDAERRASLYASIYGLGLQQRLTPKQILQILKIHVFETDYRQKIQPGDTLELFYDLEQKDGQLVPTELVYTALTRGGETRAYWRYRSHDGSVDYFNEFGENNRRFLLRKPVRGSNVRLTSGFGLRWHPILKRRKMHKGIDWAAPTGTPIIASGSGRIAFAGRKGANGNYIRIDHPNGYTTTYSHLHRIRPGMRAGKTVRQGTVIGSVGSTGMSTGAHLHFEVRINGRVVDPLKIPVPRERTLADREIKDFQRERQRLLTVMRSPPVRVAAQSN